LGRVYSQKVVEHHTAGRVYIDTLLMLTRT